jgi:hypothetical protein
VIRELALRCGRTGRGVVRAAERGGDGPRRRRRRAPRQAALPRPRIDVARYRVPPFPSVPSTRLPRSRILIRLLGLRIRSKDPCTDRFMHCTSPGRGQSDLNLGRNGCQARVVRLAIHLAALLSESNHDAVQVQTWAGNSNERGGEAERPGRDRRRKRLGTGSRGTRGWREEDKVERRRMSETPNVKAVGESGRGKGVRGHGRGGRIDRAQPFGYRRRPPVPLTMACHPDPSSACAAA